LCSFCARLCNKNPDQVGDMSTHVVHVSCAATLRGIMARSGRGGFPQDARYKIVPNAKAYLHGFNINLRRDHYYHTAAGAQHTESAGHYQAQFHWHCGEGRLTLDPLSKRTVGAFDRRYVSRPFAYHGMPYLLKPLFQAWQNEWSQINPPTGNITAVLPLRDFYPIIQAQYLGVHFIGSG